jgi:uncharacterized repeat protein (TIGR02543 family)
MGIPVFFISPRLEPWKYSRKETRMKKSTKLKMGIAALMAVIGLLFIGCPTGGGGGDGDTYYTVTFDANGGALANPSDVSVEVKEGESLGASFPGDPTKASVVFQGWFTNTSYTQEFTATTPVTGDITVIAKWGSSQLLNYNVTFNTNGGNETIPDISVLDGTVPGVNMPADPTREGYYFYGWYTDDNVWSQPFTANTLVTGVTQVYARWGTSEPVYVTITLDSDGGTGTPATIQAIQGEAAGDLPIPTKPGYTFDDWYTAADGGTRYDSTDTVTEATTLYAKWTIIEYTVTFDAAGGTLSGPASVKKNYGVALGEVDDPTRPDGIAFDGWFTQPGGAGTRYTAGTTITMNITLYANWKVDHSLDGVWYHIASYDVYVITITGDTWVQERRATSNGEKQADLAKGTLSKSGNEITIVQTHEYSGSDWQEATSPATATATLSGNSFETYVTQASADWTFYKDSGGHKTVTINNLSGVPSSGDLSLGLFSNNQGTGTPVAAAVSVTRSGSTTGPLLLYTVDSNYMPLKFWTGSGSYFVGYDYMHSAQGISNKTISFNSSSTTINANDFQ